LNYLFHLYLSGNDPDVLTGNFMGDFVKGPLDASYPPRLRRGIELHRRIDSFAQREPHFVRSRLRLDAAFGLYRGVLVDLFYDHFLATGWRQFSGLPLDGYLKAARTVVESRREKLPLRMQGLVPVIFEDMIPSYLEVSGVALALARMSRRVARQNPLAEGGGELVRHYAGLKEDFEGFLPEIAGFANGFLKES